MGALSVGLHARDIIIKKTDNGFESLFKEIPKLPIFLKNGSNKENLIRSMLLHRINEDIGLAGYDVDYDQVFSLLFVTTLGGAGELKQIHTLNHFIKVMAYGCWCNFDENRVSKGIPRDGIDQICHKWAQCNKCIGMDQICDG